MDSPTFDHLFQTDAIKVKRAALFDSPVQPMPEQFDFARIEGMMLGLAIGDALGFPTETMLPEERREAFGEIRDYVAEPHGSDDTQLAFWTVEQMISDGGFRPERLARRFCEEPIVGIGSTVSRFVRNSLSGRPWQECGPDSIGNGALMRIAAMVIPHLKSSGPELWKATATSAMLTHNSSGSIASCVSFVNILWQTLRLSGVPEARWWPATFVETARQLEVASYRPRGGAFADFDGPIWQFVEEKVTDAYDQDLSVLDACNLWHSGASLIETVPSVIYILMRHGDDPEEAIVRAVNDTKDNDTIAAIVGAALGALHGRDRLPKRWISELPGRVSPGGEGGAVFELIEQAKACWWSGR